MLKILFTGVHRPNRSPSQRYRIEQFLPFLQSKGFYVNYTYLITASVDKYIYKQGHYFSKSLFFLKAIIVRYFETFLFAKYDVVFVQREAIFAGFTFYERKASLSKAIFVFDFDDAIWQQHISEGNRSLAFLKDPLKTQKLIEMADLVLCGNDYLRQYASKFNSNAQYFPTVVDTERYKPHFSTFDKGNVGAICIGWSGSFSTFEHYSIVINVLEALYLKYGHEIYFKVIGAETVSLPFPVNFVKWTEETEVAELAEFDIGLMPLPDNEWSKGKCALKGLLYMSMAIPAVMSPIGVNSQIIVDGENGYLPATEQEWIKSLTLLIEDAGLRKKIGANARKFVVEKYSVASKQELFVELLLSTKKQKRGF